MKRLVSVLATAVCLAAPLVSDARAEDRFDAPGNFNPIVPGYFADPTIKKFGDTFYLYSTTDGNGGGRGPSQVWASRDFVHWTLIPMNWPRTPLYWAPDVAKQGDKYYLYYCQPCTIYGGSSNSPVGPWVPLGGGEGVVVPNFLVKNIITLDGQTFEDDDHRHYMYWTTWGIYPDHGCGWGLLNDDMKSFSKLGRLPNTELKDIFEGPFMLKRHNKYFMMYSSGDCSTETYRVQYAVGDSPAGTFKMGLHNPILASDQARKVDGPGHHSVLQQGNDYYLVYQRHDIPRTPNGLTRQVCADRLEFEGDEAIKAVVPSHQGVGLLAPNTEPSKNLAFCKPVKADSFYKDTLRGQEYRPEYAVDDNNATLWRPADNKMGHWLTVDLGAPTRIRRVLTQFEYATWYYQYKLETSNDGQTWKAFADRTENRRWGSPMIDRGVAEARFLRLTVTGVEVPGLLGAVWNIKVYGEDRVDPLEAVADQAFERFVKADADKVPPSRALRVEQPIPLIELDAAKLALGSSLRTWDNAGSVGGTFAAQETPPTVGLVGGRKAVQFSGRGHMTASFRTPRALTGNSSFTVSAWVLNPEIAEGEAYLSWAGRGGPDACTAQFAYGSSPAFAAVGHGGFADMNFGGKPPEASRWHHLAVTHDGVLERVYVDGVLKNTAAKLLLMNADREVYLGASAPGTENFSGSLASLRVYDAALDANAVARLAADAPAMEVSVQLDAARLDDGPLRQWENQGGIAGAFPAAGAAPQVADVAGRLAVEFKPGQTMSAAFRPDAKPEGYALVATVLGGPGRAEAFRLTDGAGGSAPLSMTLPDARWHQVAFTAEGTFVDGARTGDANRLPPNATGLQLGGNGFTGAFSRVQVFTRSLTAATVGTMHAAWKAEWTAPVPEFAVTPKALSPALVAMSARAPNPANETQYRFEEMGGTSSGWQDRPFFFADDPKPGARYRVKVRDQFGNVAATAFSAGVSNAPQNFTLFQPDLGPAHDFLRQGVQGTGWSGVLPQGPGSTTGAIMAQDGKLRLASKDSQWDGSPAHGPFLYREASGDFVAQVRVADYRAVGSNEGSLMVRLQKKNGPEDLLYLAYFPPWGQGNMLTDMVHGGRRQKSNMLGDSARKFLRVVRLGAAFHLQVSPDGKKWEEMPESPIEWADGEGKVLQVGLAHAAYGAQESGIAFSDFSLSTGK